MTLQDDLAAAVATLSSNMDSLGTAIVSNDTAIQAEVAALTAAINGGDQTAMQTAINNISAASSKAADAAKAIQAETATLTASLAPPVTTTTPPAATPPATPAS